MRKCNWVEGEWRDITLMGMLEEDWKKKKQLGEEVQTLQ